ncbi:MAG: class I SAM-dependent methyltransferase [Myxococcales bacterium]|nr:class I SAM-dependent methyltransferase [Myxococcales bacterium]
MTSRDWNEDYAAGVMPWDTGEPEPFLVDFVEGGNLSPGARVVEVGCGTGTNALWLARRGFDVIACDCAPLALERARKKADGVPGLRFVEHDFLSDALPEGPFDFAFDRGVFHVFDEAGQRARFAERVGRLLRPGGHWASLAGSTEGPPRDHGPPRRSLRDLADAIEPWLEVVEVRRIEFEAKIPSPAAAWWLLARAREIPAQPSTRH